MKFKTFEFSNIGGRPNNEDAVGSRDNIWVLADGLGGHESGEVASKIAVETTLNSWKKDKSFSNENILGIVDAVNKAVLDGQKKNEKAREMRTTLCVAFSDGKCLKMINVGDSRIYYFRNGSVIFQTQDHSVAALSVMTGEIPESEIRYNEDRNKLLKVIGNGENLKIKASYEDIEIQPGDAFLICTDGFWEHIYEIEMEIDLAKSEKPREWISYMAKRILLKNEGKDHDNFSAIAVFAE